MKVIYIVGKGRSGSTLLDIALNSIPGFFSTGELWRRWGDAAFEDYTCGCGKTLENCELWADVLTRSLRLTGTQFDEVVTSELVLEWERQTERWHKVPRLLGRRAEDLEADSIIARLRHFKTTVYQRIASVLGTDVIVDSSKIPFLLGPLGLLPDIDGFIIHLVRDSRAVAHSWRRAKTFLPDDTRPMPRFGPVYSAMSWNARNVLSEYVGRRQGDRYLRVRYEDFVDSPREILERIVGLVGVGQRELPVEGERTLLIEPNHTVWGNKSRFRTGRVSLQRDSAWREQMSLREILLVTSLTWPLLRRYDYGFAYETHLA
jgi:hypothetical protein